MGKDKGASDTGNITKVFTPKLPLVFDIETRAMTIFEVCDYLKKLPYLTTSSYILSFASAFLMMNGFAQLSLIKGAVFTLPFVTLLAFATYVTQQSTLMISKIELL